MSLPVLSRAQLLHILVRLPQAEWPAAARAAGFDLRAETPEPPAKPEKPREPTPPQPPKPPDPDPAPYRPSDLPDLPFWRVAAHRLLGEDEWPSAAPAWLASATPWADLPESDPGIKAPESPALAPRARQARFLRQQLARPQRGEGIDLARLCRQLAERRIPPRLPRQLRSAWPGRVRLLIDLSPGLRPFRADFWRWSEQLRQILGQRLQCLATRSGHPAEVVAAETGRRIRLQAAEGPLIVLGDAGLYAPESPRHRAWREFGAHCVRQGLRPLLLAPCPPRYLTAEFAAGFSCVLLERGAPLHPLRGRRGGGRKDGPPHPPEASPATAELLAALSLGARTEPPLLRTLRLALAERGADIGCEYEAWNHPGVYADELACALRPGPRAEARQALEALPPARRQALARLRSAGNRHLSPLVILEEALVAGELVEAEELQKAIAEAESYAATLYQPTGQDMQQPLAAYIAALGRRRPELLAQSPQLAAAWGLAHRDQLAAGRLPALPASLGLQQLEWLMPAGQPRRPVYLGQVGGQLGVYADEPERQPVCHLGRLSVAGEFWQVEAAREDATQETDAPTVLSLGQSLPLETERRYRLTLGRHRLELETVRRPAWAVGMGRDGEGLFAELRDGRRVYWMAEGRVRVAGALRADGTWRHDGSQRRDGGARFPLPHGFWWDEAEYRGWLESGKWFKCPDWAVRHGVDNYGWWAEFEIEGVVQRMRWIPPGEFRMGSPEDEAERSKDDSQWSERQHPVMLTQGYWLADTACTQALWQAVLGESPSGFGGTKQPAAPSFASVLVDRLFEGAERPVEQVSWQDVAERFLPALNAAVPGLEAALPTEAQWEYACRAGSTTPFWFGENITPEQVNYNGNRPYAQGKKGLYRETTVDVKALPANGWGLYQMHGNVWEWCADWLGEYPREAVQDPAGPPGGRARVLRGGSWISGGGRCRSARRDGSGPGERIDYIGFRLARGSSPRQAGSAGVAGVAAGSGAEAAAPDSPARG